MENNFLLEILVQELPYQFIPSAEKQLADIFKKLLDDNKLNRKELFTKEAKEHFQGNCSRG